MKRDLIRHFNDARKRGFSPTRAARWAAYCNRPDLPYITLDEAVAQVQVARATH